MVWIQFAFDRLYILPWKTMWTMPVRSQHAPHVTKVSINPDYSATSSAEVILPAPDEVRILRSDCLFHSWERAQLFAESIRQWINILTDWCRLLLPWYAFWMNYLSDINPLPPPHTPFGFSSSELQLPLFENWDYKYAAPLPRKSSLKAQVQRAFQKSDNSSP